MHDRQAPHTPASTSRQRWLPRGWRLPLSPLLALAPLLALWPPLPATASEPSAVENTAGPPGTTLGGDWVRLVHDDSGEAIALQTAIVRYVPADQVATTEPEHLSVDLIGAVHVGDLAYYRALNRRFRNYDALLYELVAPDGTVVRQGRGTSNAHPIGAVQNSMKEMLGLEHQLEQIDYNRPNFHHADMSPGEFADSMNRRGEGFMQMYFRLMGQSIGHQSRGATQGESSNFRMFSALFSSDRTRQLKLVLAEQLAEMETLFLDFGGKQGSTLINERNKVALAVLKEQLGEGKQRMGIFYGAGHLSDMDQRLRDEFNLRPVQVDWVDAWNLAP